MISNLYQSPQVLTHVPIRFETAPSECGSFPGLGWGVDGKPAKERGEFPGGGPNKCGFPGVGPTNDNRP